MTLSGFGAYCDMPGSLFAFNDKREGTCCVSHAVMRSAMDEDAVKPVNVNSVNGQHPAPLADAPLLNECGGRLNIGCGDCSGVTINDRSGRGRRCERQQRREHR